MSKSALILLFVFFAFITLPTSAQTDTDGDGLDDAWEIANFGDITAYTGTDDPDADRCNNLCEMTNETDPNNPDTDGDGLSDYQEIYLLTSSPLHFDTDNDGLNDFEEYLVGTDPLDPDTDGDGLIDGNELPNNADPRLADTDADGLIDYQEVQAGTDPGLFDTDADGLSDYEEIFVYGCDPLLYDTDGDAVSDYGEAMEGTYPGQGDNDNDNLGNYDEVYTFMTSPLDPDTDDDGLNDGDEVNTYNTDPTTPDTDGDQLTDYEEIVTYAQWGFSPLLHDTDGDGINDYDELNMSSDADNDGLPDAWELQYFGDIALYDGDDDPDNDTVTNQVEFFRATDPANPDSDDDGLSDFNEIFVSATNPNNPDTDADGLLDGAEVFNWNTDPLKQDTDLDGLTDYDEVITYGTNPTLIDTDADDLSDADEITVYCTDPLSDDTDNDYLSDGDEVLIYESDPLVADFAMPIDPVDISITNIVPDLSFSWSGRPDTDSYRIFVRNNNRNPVINEIIQCQESICNLNVDPLIPAWGMLNGSFEWWVGAFVPNVGWSWSDKATFTVAIPAATTPANIVADPREGRPRITWDADPNAWWLQIWIGGAGNGRSYTNWHELDGANLSYTCDTTTCSLEPAIDWPGADYNLWLRSWGPGGMSEWVQGPTLSLPTTPPLAPVNIAVDTSGAPLVSWDASQNATWYEVWVTTPQYATSYRQWHLASTLGCGETPASCGLTVNDLQSGDYLVFVRAWGPGGFSTGGTDGNPPQWNRAEFTVSE